MEESPDASDVNSPSNDDDDLESCEDNESLVDSADYDTDLELEGQ